MVTDVEQAKVLALEHRPGFKVLGVVEKDTYFVVDTIPGTFSVDDFFIGGAVRVDKQTGTTSLYRPYLEVNNA